MKDLQIKDKNEEKEGELVQLHFPLHDSPYAVQLTVHINNLFSNEYSKKAILKIFKSQLTTGRSPAGMAGHSANFRIKQIIQYYGKACVKQWFVDIYGWEFSTRKRKVS